MEMDGIKSRDPGLILTVATVDEIRPDDIFLREAEDAEATALVRHVGYVTGIGNQPSLLEEQHPENVQTNVIRFTI